LYQTLFPWNLYFTHPTVANKISGYAYLRAKLHVKVVCNCGPFRYTYGMMTYMPLCGTPTADSFSSADMVDDVTFNAAQTQGAILRSQRPRAFFAPQANMGCDMTLPFVSPQEWIDMRNLANIANNLSHMGRLTLETFFPLATATTAVTDVITYNVYAWCDEIDLNGPTLNYQSKDEYGKGVVSDVASAASEYVNALGQVPMIGKYAKATSVALKGVGMFASAFGFTNPPVLADTMPMRPSFLNQMASADISLPVEKLSLDPKNELSIDPSVSGHTSEDELSIASLVQRESFLGLVPWATTSTSGTGLISANVTPETYAYNVATTGTLPYKYASMALPPFAWISNMFRFWRGSIKYRFVIVASPFHKGRLRFIYDPAGDFPATIAEGRVLTRIVDISETTEFEMEIPYMQPTHWCDLLGLTTTPTLTNGNFTRNITFANGTVGTAPYSTTAYNGAWRVEVLTALGAGTVSSPAYILVFASCGSDFEFAAPDDIVPSEAGVDTVPGTLTYTQPLLYQGPKVIAESDVPDEKPDCLCPVIRPARDSSSLVFMGERILSIRQLFHRTNFYTCMKLGQWTMPITAGGSFQYVAQMPRQPRSPGSVLTTFAHVSPTSRSLHSAAAGPSRFNFVPFSPLTYVTPAFLGQRGSVVWKFHPLNFSDLQFTVLNASRCHLMRYPAVYLGDNSTGIGASGTTTLSGGAAMANLLEANFGGSLGMSVAPTRVIPSVEFSSPMYSKFRFLPTRHNNIGSTICNPAVVVSDEAIRIVARVTTTALPSTALPINPAIDAYYHAGADYSAVFFLNVPLLYFTTIIPNAI